MNDDYRFVTFIGSHHQSDLEEGIAFLGTIGSNTPPYGQADFMIKCPINKPNFELLSVYDEQSPKNDLSADQFVKRHFNYDFQNSLKVIIKRECSDRGNCKLRYHLNTQLITFDMGNQIIDSIELNDEFFWIEDKNKIFCFKTDFTIGKTFIQMTKQDDRVHWHDCIEIDSEKFLRYPLDREFLLNKLKTLLVFS